MNLFSNQIANGFPNPECRAVAIPGIEHLAWCITMNSSQCPHALRIQKKNLCSHVDCQAIARRTTTEAGEAAP